MLAAMALAAFAAGCGPGDEDLPDADSGASGTPAGAGGMPAETVEESLPPDSVRRPERRPVRTIPPLTRPDSGRP